MMVVKKQKWLYMFTAQPHHHIQEWPPHGQIIHWWNHGWLLPRFAGSNWQHHHRPIWGMLLETKHCEDGSIRHVLNSKNLKLHKFPTNIYGWPRHVKSWGDCSDHESAQASIFQHWWKVWLPMKRHICSSKRLPFVTWEANGKTLNGTYLVKYFRVVHFHVENTVIHINMQRFQKQSISPRYHKGLWGQTVESKRQLDGWDNPAEFAASMVLLCQVSPVASGNHGWWELQPHSLNQQRLNVIKIVFSFFIPGVISQSPRENKGPASPNIYIYKQISLSLYIYISNHNFNSAKPQSY